MSTLLLSPDPQNIKPGCSIQPPSFLIHNPPESDFFLNQLEKYSLSLKSLRYQVDSLAKETIKVLNSNCNSFLSLISEIESRLESLANCSNPSTEVLFYLSKTMEILPDLSEKSSKLFKTISETFYFPSHENFPIPSNLSKKFSFFFNQHTGNLTQIDIETQESSQKPTYPKFPCSFNAGADLGSGQFFLHGGSKNYEASSESCIFDLYLDQVKPVPRSNYARSGNVCVKKGEKILAFGSSYKVSTLCEAFDLEKFTWAKINSLPQRTLFMTGSVVDGEVLLTGSGICGFWDYSEESDCYRIVCGAPAGFKVIIDNFLIASDCILEIEDLHLENCRKYRSDWICCPLSLAVIRKFKDKFYFVDCQARLICFDPCLKSTRIIPYLNI